MELIPRKIARDVLFSLQNSPVVFVNGPRQAGKSTLVQELAKNDFPAEYITFDNTTQMAAAASSPHTFLSTRPHSVIIDEVQMVPDMFRALKVVVDKLRAEDKATANGRFLLTGSANIMALPKLSDPLVGRINVKTLYPFAVCETREIESSFISRLFNGDFSNLKKTKFSLNQAIRVATYPEISGKKIRERTEWFDGYITTILQRDVRMLSELEKLAMLPTMLRVLAARAGSLMNDASIARDVGLNPVTSKSYRGVLQAMFLTLDIQPWYRNIGKRLVKSPKGYLLDTLLLCHLLDVQLEGLREKRPELYGHIVENFVATEITKLLSFSEFRANLYHLRTSDNKEVDFVLERPDGSIVGVEVKSSDMVKARDFQGLKVLAESSAKDFVCGIILYAGEDVIPFGENLFAVPFDALWS